MKKNISDNEILAECALEIDKHVENKMLNESAANRSISL